MALSADHPPPPRRVLMALFAMAAVAALIRLIPLAWLHPLNWDEIEFFRATDWIRRGLAPYRDFWEHHTPLQWVLFAPFTGFTSSPGISAVIFMRWMQIPLWVAIFWMTARWMKQAGTDRSARWAAIVLALSSSILMLPAVEYRVDVLGCALYIGGLLLMQRMGSSRWMAVAAGAAFCLAGFANLRLGPLLAVTVLLARVDDFERGKWGGNQRGNWIYAGVAGTFAVALGLFAAAGSLRQLYQQVWVENYLGDRWATPVERRFLHRLLVTFGFRTDDPDRYWSLLAIDPGGAALLILGVMAMVRAFRGWRSPGHHFFLSFAQLASIAFIAAMKYVYNYHLMIVALLMIPLAASEIERLVVGRARQKVLLGLLAVCVLASVALSIFRGKELDRQYQDLIMREAHARTAPGEKVWDGIGWALRREPAYRFWFLPELARQLVRHGYAQPYHLQDWMADPPAAIVADYNAVVWLAGVQRPLGRFVERNYVPLWRNLWLPGMNVRLTPSAPAASYLVLRDGQYHLYGSTALADHLWLMRPIQFSLYWKPDARKYEVDLRAHRRPPLSIRVDGALIPNAETIALRRGQRVELILRGDQNAGVFLLSFADPVIFRQPPPGVTLEGALPRQTHIPDFRAVFSAPIPTSSAPP